MNRAYEFAIRLNDLMSGPLRRISQAYSSQVSQWERLNGRVQAGFAKAAQSVDQLKRKMSFGKETQSIDQLRAKMDALTRQRNLSLNTGDIKRANREIDALQTKMNKLESAGRGGGRGGGSGGFMGGLMGAAMPALGAAAIIAGAGAFAKSGMDAEQTRMAYEQFAGQQASALYEQMNDFANKTSFSNSEILTGGRTMLAAGFDARQIEPMMNTIGNIAAGAKKNFADLVGTVAKIKQKGFVDGGELHQEFGGTPLMEILQKNLGVDGETLFKMAENHQIKYSDLVKAMVDMTTGDGVFAGYLDKDMNTAQGKLSTFLGTLMYKMSQIAESLNPVFRLILDSGIGLLDALEPVFGSIGNLFKAFEPLFQAVSRLLALFGLGGESAGLLTVVLNGVAFAINGVAYLVNLLSTAINFLVSNPISAWIVAGGLIILNLGTICTWLGSMALLLGEAILSVVMFAKAWWAANAAMLACPAVWIVAAIAAVVATIAWAIENVDWFRESLIKLWEVAKAVFSSIGKAWDALMDGDFKGIGKAFADGIAQGMKNADVRIKADRTERAKANLPKVPAAPKQPGLAGSPGGKGGGGTGGKQGVGDAAGLNATAGGTKSTTITINLKSLVENIRIQASGVQEGLDDVEAQVTDSLLRVLSSANSMATD